MKKHNTKTTACEYVSLCVRMCMYVDVDVRVYVENKEVSSHS